LFQPSFVGISSSAQKAPPKKTVSSPAIVVPSYTEENGIGSDTFPLLTHQTSPGGRRRNQMRKLCLSDFTFLKVLGKGSFGKVSGL